MIKSVRCVEQYSHAAEEHLSYVSVIDTEDEKYLLGPLPKQLAELISIKLSEENSDE